MAEPRQKHRDHLPLIGHHSKLSKCHHRNCRIGATVVWVLIALAWRFNKVEFPCCGKDKWLPPPLWNGFVLRRVRVSFFQDSRLVESVGGKQIPPLSAYMRTIIRDEHATSTDYKASKTLLESTLAVYGIPSSCGCTSTYVLFLHAISRLMRRLCQCCISLSPRAIQQQDLRPKNEIRSSSIRKIQRWCLRTLRTTF